MFARRKTFWCKRMAVWQTLFCLSVLAFLCRAFIPVGYMPDSSSERQSPFAITLCSMGGTTLVQLDLSAEPDSSSHDGSYAETCPYGLSISSTFTYDDALILAGTAAFHALVHPVGSQTALPAPALGPPLGSRAPPAASAVLPA